MQPVQRLNFVLCMLIPAPLTHSVAHTGQLEVVARRRIIWLGQSASE